MRRADGGRRIVRFGGFTLIWLVGSMLLPASTAGQTAASTDGEYEPVVQRYCITCHNARLRTANLALDKLDLAHPGTAIDVWEKVVQKLRGRAMPPPGRPRPDDATYDRFATWLEASLDRAAEANPNPGRPLLHRMNRAEYRNAVRDLLGFEIDVDALPPDNEAYGFDNIADALSVSPLLLESYVTTALKVARLAIGDPGAPPVTRTHPAPPFLSQRAHLDGLPPGSRGGMRVEEYLPADGEYEVRIRLQRNGAGSISGIAEEHHIELALDGERIALYAVGSPDAYTPLNPEVNNPQDAVNKAFTADEHMRRRLPMSAGAHTLTATFVGKPTALTTARFSRVGSGDGRGRGVPSVDAILVTGPFDARSPRGIDTVSRERVFVCYPATVDEEEPCARTILSRLGRLAYRGPLTKAERETLMGFYREGWLKGDFETGVELALRFLLASPEFVFRAEAEPASIAPGTAYPVSDLDLASRLSFFLWSSLPDDELLTVAEAGGFADPAELERQVHRMLADPRASALTRFG